MNQNTSKHHILCIVCPEGCEMEIEEQHGDLLFPEGICRRGQEYARQEIYNPCRVLTTTVQVRDGNIAMLPVRTSQPIPRAKLPDAMQDIASIVVNAPVAVGDIVCENVVNTGAKLIACREIRFETSI